MLIVFWIVLLVAGAGLVVWGAEAFAQNLGAAAVHLGVSSVALALLLAGAEPEELATALIAAVRGSPGIALGDIIGANVTICLVALGVGAVFRPLSFVGAFRYALLGFPLGAIGTWTAWDGKIGRVKGGILVALYIAYVAAIWILERRPPALGELAELQESREHVAKTGVGRDLVFVLLGVIAMAFGEAVRIHERAAIEDGFGGLYVFSSLNTLSSGSPDYFEQAFRNPNTNFPATRYAAFAVALCLNRGFDANRAISDT